jgi:23S rRNA pseudouridine1911/1915/1917 synthase
VETFSGIVDTEEPVRLDRYASENLGIMSRSQMKSRTMEATLNGKAVKLSKPVKKGDRLELSWQEFVEEKLVPENLPLNILYEDSRVIVINKEPGMVVHPGAGNPGGTMANALLYRRLNRMADEAAPAMGEAAEAGLAMNGAGPRTGIVHRLDKDTSGVIIAAWDDAALAFLAAQFKARKTKKRYAAIVHGVPQNSGIIDMPLIRDPQDRKRFTVSAVPGKGKPAQTRFRIIRSWDAYSLLLLRPRTGRTHQIRVHLKSIGHSIVGDPVYGRRDSRGEPRTVHPANVTGGLMLHAYSLEICLPGHDSTTLFKAPLPRRFREFVKTLHT